MTLYCIYVSWNNKLEVSSCEIIKETEKAYKVDNFVYRNQVKKSEIDHAFDDFGIRVYCFDINNGKRALQSYFNSKIEDLQKGISEYHNWQQELKEL